jgi:predicted MFS family arabinose efflux permease
MAHEATARDPDHHERERLLRMLAVATFVIFFQAYMVAPIIPALSSTFGTSVQTVGLIVPAYPLVVSIRLSSGTPAAEIRLSVR